MHSNNNTNIINNFWKKIKYSHAKTLCGSLRQSTDSKHGKQQSEKTLQFNTICVEIKKTVLQLKEILLFPLIYSKDYIPCRTHYGEMI